MSCCPQSGVYLLPLVPVCSKLAGFCPSLSPGPLLPSTPGGSCCSKGKTVWEKQKKTVSGERCHLLACPHGTVQESRGVAGVCSPPRSCCGWMVWASRVGWMSSSWLHLQGSCGVQGGRRGPSGFMLGPPLTRGHVVGCGTVRSGEVLSPLAPTACQGCIRGRRTLPRPGERRGQEALGVTSGSRELSLLPVPMWGQEVTANGSSEALSFPCVVLSQHPLGSPQTVTRPRRDWCHCP